MTTKTDRELVRISSTPTPQQQQRQPNSVKRQQSNIHNKSSPYNNAKSTSRGLFVVKSILMPGYTDAGANTAFLPKTTGTSPEMDTIGYPEKSGRDRYCVSTATTTTTKKSIIIVGLEIIIA
jgi:hypothetical protein